MRDDPENAPNVASEPDLKLDLPEGTDPAVLFAPRSGETVVAESPLPRSSPETEFIGRPYAAGELEVTVARPASPSSSPATIRTPRQRLVRRLIFSTAFVGLTAVTAASLYEFWQIVAAEGEQPTPPPEEKPAASPTRVPPEPTPTNIPPIRSTPELEELRRGEDAAALLALKVQAIREDDRPVDIALRNGPIKDRQVTVVNLWATYCDPCKREMPELKAMFEEFEKAGWGDKVVFVPILDSDSRDPVWARDMFGPTMPRTTHFLVDQDGSLRSAVRRFLKGSRKKKSLDLPVTLVFDCQSDLRQIHPGVLLPPDITALREQLETLYDELGAKYCQPSRKPKPSGVQPPSEVKSAPRCGDGTCTPPTETEANCCDCLNCAGGDRCRQTPGKAVCLGDLK